MRKKDKFLYIAFFWKSTGIQYHKDRKLGGLWRTPLSLPFLASKYWPQLCYFLHNSSILHPPFQLICTEGHWDKEHSTRGVLHNYGFIATCWLPRQELRTVRKMLICKTRSFKCIWIHRAMERNTRNSSGTSPVLTVAVEKASSWANGAYVLKASQALARAFSSAGSAITRGFRDGLVHQRDGWSHVVLCGQGCSDSQHCLWAGHRFYRYIKYICELYVWGLKRPYHSTGHDSYTCSFTEEADNRNPVQMRSFSTLNSTKDAGGGDRKLVSSSFAAGNR